MGINIVFRPSFRLQERRTHMAKYMDENGVENFGVGVITQARKDFIRGAKILYKHTHTIPTYKELIADPTHAKLSNDADVRWMYDAWQFVRDDPYQFFGDVGEETTIKEWKKIAIEKYYRVLYLKGAEAICRSTKTKHPESLDDSAIVGILKESAGEFIAAKNYISKLQNAKELFHKWNVIAFSRSRHGITAKRRKTIDTEYHRELIKQKAKNVKRAKELYEDGISERAIAKELGVQLNTVRVYLKS